MQKQMKLEMNKLRKLDTGDVIELEWNEFVNEKKYRNEINASITMDAGMKMNIGKGMNVHVRHQGWKWMQCLWQWRHEKYSYFIPENTYTHT